ncbi:MAG: glycosyltransferase family 4 protein [Planctomycetes bacterium]|nr:glycosyltransferase family 4 protein [Planctomycetota bacterium]
MQVHQLTQGFSSGDATSNMALRLQAVLREMGHASEIFSEPAHIGPREKDRCRDVREHAARSAADGVLLYHYGGASALSDYFAAAPDRKVLFFHNVTPPEYFRALFPATAARLERARDDLGRLAACTDLCCGVSRFNLDTLAGLPFRQTMHFPGWMDRALLARPPARAVLRQYADNYTNILFVGRIAPNKKIEDLIATFACLKAGARGRNLRLIVAGTHVGLELYHAWLLSLCRRMGLRDVIFTGHVAQEELNAFHALADAFVCASEHEGFGIPILEAMHFGAPVFAYDIPGVRETLGGSGVLFRTRDFKRAAETIRLVLDNPALRDAIVSGQRERLKAFDETRLNERVKEMLERAHGAVA